MKLDLTFDNKFMVVSSDFPFELITLHRELTRELSDAWIRRKVQPTANTQRCFVNEYGMIPIGLWLEVMKVAKKFNIYLELSPAAQTYFSSFQFNFDQFNNYITRTFNGAECPDKDIPGKMNPFKPREYQIKSAYTLLKYRNSCGEISTSGGKTLISFIIFKYLIDCCYTKKILYIVPSVDLATQSAEKYEQYEGYLKIHGHDWKIGILKSGLKKKEKEAVENCNILFGTFQSLCRRPLEFFQDFTAVVVDECCHPDTIITMANGEYKKIKDVKIGDKVLTYNETTCKKEIKEVEYVYKNLSKNQQMYEIEREDGKILRLTGNHKVLTQRGYIRVDELLETDELLDINEVI